MPYLRDWVEKNSSFRHGTPKAVASVNTCRLISPNPTLLRAPRILRAIVIAVAKLL